MMPRTLRTAGEPSPAKDPSHRVARRSRDGLALVASASLLAACSGSGDRTPVAGQPGGGVPGAPIVNAGAGAPATGLGGAPSTGPTATVPGAGAAPASSTGAGGGAASPPVAGGAAGVVPPTGAGGAAGGAPGSSGGATGAVGGATGASMAGATGAGGAAPTMDPPGTATISTGSFTVQPGQEVFKCQNFDNPFAGKDTALSTLSSVLAKGSHHLHLYNLTEGTSRTIGDCDPNDFHALLYATGRETDQMAYPAGMATKIRGNTGLRVQLHFLNTTSDPLEGKSSVKMIPTADPSSVTKWVASLYFNRIYLSVPPGQGQTVTTSCSIPSAYGPIGLVRGVSHMHSRGVHFVAQTSTGVPLIDDTTWDEPPPHVYDPPIMLNPGDSIDWTCTYDNNTGKTLTFGDSAATNEMCIYVARYFSTNANDVQIVCMAPGEQGGTASLESN